MASTEREYLSPRRLHQFAIGSLPVAAYLAGWPVPVYAALALSLLALATPRLAVVARLHRWLAPSATGDSRWNDLDRLDELWRSVLLAGGLVGLATGHPLGWLPVLAAGSVSLLEGVTGLEVGTVVHGTMLHLAGKVPEADSAHACNGNPDCLLCRAFGEGPHSRCRYCRLSSLRWCCGLQVSLLLMLLMVIAFLLIASMQPAVTRMLVGMSIFVVIGLGLAVNRQTDDLVNALDDLAVERRREARHVEFLRRLTLTRSAEAVARATVDHVSYVLGARRVSVMVAEEDGLRILASCGIDAEVARNVRVPLDSGVAGKVFEAGRPKVFHDIRSEAPDEALGLAGTGGAAASVPLISAPMAAGEQKIGCLNVTDKPNGTVTEQELSELEFVAEAAAIALAEQFAHRDQERAQYGTIRALVATVEAKDAYTHGHSVRVTKWAMETGRRMGLSRSDRGHLARAADLHDIGKIAIPDDILKGTRKLTEQEWLLVRQHPHRGVQMIEHLKFLEGSLPIILHHHERWDGEGYPAGLAGADIPIGARILAVADAYDAMTSDRPYRDAMNPDAAAEEVRACAGSQFDPKCVDAFLEVIEETGDLSDEVSEAVIRSGAAVRIA